MKDTTVTDYEWDVEVVEAPGDDGSDIVEHLFQASFADCVRERAAVPGRFDGCVARVVLVCDVTDRDGRGDRYWAYLRADGSLPERFEDAWQTPVGPKVPARFHAECKRG